MIFNRPFPERSQMREKINAVYRADETEYVNFLLHAATLSDDAKLRIDAIARQLVVEIRKERLHKSGLDAFLFQYNLSSEEGIALMCLAEALLRIPDKATKDELIEDKITSVNWEASMSKSESFFVNAATWSLMLTGKILHEDADQHNKWQEVLKKLIKNTSEPVIRSAVSQAVKILGKQFVMGETIKAAMKRARENESKGYLYSYDMLGESARTAEDAERYFEAYVDAIDALSKVALEINETNDAPSISIKLSALHPRYEYTQYEKVLPEITAKVHELVRRAKAANIGVTIDAEEADRLEFSLDIITSIISNPEFAGWDGFGFAVQAYQKRALPTIQWVVDLARRHKRRITLRLVKGAYWDYEIKDSQVKGLEGYPVFTRKPATDLSYIACAKEILSAMDVLYPQFGTHNAHTVATILELAGNNRQFEFQCLHGMGNALYDQMINNKDFNIRCRIYAPVGTQKDLLGYLVRRLLENGANTSFVNRIVDEKAPLNELIADPITKMKNYEIKPNPKISLPADIYGSDRKNSRGIDLSNTDLLKQLAEKMEIATSQPWIAMPLIGEKLKQREAKPITDPSDRRRVIGSVIEATTEDVNVALARAYAATKRWDETSVATRAGYLERAADLFEQHMPELIAIAIREAGKSIPDSISEVREAIDYCRFYAVQAKKLLQPITMPGPTGEFNQLEMHGRGVIACISPWNFPLAIFTGQITAALAAGNTVIAKPAEQTPLMATRAVQLFHEAGIPDDVLQLLPGRGEVVGAALVGDERVKGIVFTGSTETARLINQALAKRPGPLTLFIAETGGQNAIIVDSTALPEQVIGDVLMSSFNSAGQRCSAARVLYVQEDIADKLITMLKGAMAELQVGDPGLLATDVGPVIDEDAKKMLEAHAAFLSKHGKLIYEAQLPSTAQYGTYFAPRAYEIESLAMLEREVFGPILHVIRYKQNELDKVIEAVNNTGYGLTLGIHTRINEKIDYIQQRIHVGNTYVNRNIIGAVVGVQPFGGEGLSGTGPKAGGPHYLYRLVAERTLTVNTTAVGGNASLLALGD